jgi:hypothetical protein
VPACSEIVNKINGKTPSRVKQIVSSDSIQ